VAAAVPRGLDLSQQDQLRHVLRRAALYLLSCEPAVAGRGGHAATFWAARVLTIGFALPEPIAYELLAQFYNPQCVPPWGEEELWHKVRDAAVEDGFDKPKGWLLPGRPFVPGRGRIQDRNQRAGRRT
jgi:hypothetical protein